MWYVTDCKLDTLAVVSSVKSGLKRLKIRQQVFADHVNRTQGTLSAILRKPTPWHMLKSGHDIYWKMAEWLNLSDQIKLQLSSGSQIRQRKPCKRSLNHRRADNSLQGTININDNFTTPNTEFKSDCGGASNFTKMNTRISHGNQFTSQNETISWSNVYVDNLEGSSNEEVSTGGTTVNICRNNEQIIDIPETRAKKKFSFAKYQKQRLLLAFAENSCPSKECMHKLAEDLDLSYSSVKNFFLNSRQRAKSK